MRLVIFDMDGTLVDSEALIVETVDRGVPRGERAGAGQ